MRGVVQERTIRQTLDEPITSLPMVRDHTCALARLVDWSVVGVLYDETPNAVVVVCLADDVVVAAARICVPIEDTEHAITAFCLADQPLALRCRQGRSFTRTEIRELSALSDHWARSQGSTVSAKEISAFYQRVADEIRARGREARVSSRTSHQVWFEAHGRCMFDGCGADLTRDSLTGVRNNFGYVAHNVAASEKGPRGILYLSSVLEDEPSNILLLCDTHHRLVDGIAKADYPAEALNDMRNRFCENADSLLDGLQRSRIPAFCVSWPVHRQVISAPSDLQISQALMPIGVRLEGQLRRLNDNEKILRDIEPGQMWPLMPDTIKRAAADILSQTHTQSYRAALFAMGLMPALIGLGALLGNKCEITPMLRDRESGLWFWPSDEPTDSFYTIEGLDMLPSSAKEVILELAFTARPTPMITAATQLGCPVITVLAKELRNGALAHPVDGYRFRQSMQELLHRLSDQHNVERVHLLPCASNAACVFFGQSFDSFHPELLVYDFNGDSMIPRLRLANSQNVCEVTTVS